MSQPALHQVVRHVVIAARRDTVFRFFTDPERFAAWWGAGSTIARHSRPVSRRQASPASVRTRRLPACSSSRCATACWCRKRNGGIPPSPSPRSHGNSSVQRNRSSSRRTASVGSCPAGVSTSPSPTRSSSAWALDSDSAARGGTSCDPPSATSAGSQNCGGTSAKDRTQRVTASVSCTVPDRHTAACSGAPACSKRSPSAHATSCWSRSSPTPLRGSTRVR